ncbi:MAG: 7-carboxy-7-deazaguanine synthase QueE [Pontiellaceae bacterium]|nr:7-carboxy-7-deazaguanine synthase QueE [Pontiellaceae bacterium]MBN2785567.1 7-carboxy-7-deazaguanine synthase QueE [Pontiellaceae bacterium]
MKTYLSEIFSSVQGEGPYVGERHLFVRFCGCHRDCIFCDTNTDRTETVLIEMEPGSGNFEQVPNPLTVDQLVELIKQVDRKKNNRRISLTGGAPLLQAHYLRELLPRLCGEEYSIYLETAGDLPQQLKSIIEWVDVVAMDVKLASVTKEPATFPAHWQFLKTCRDFDVEVFVKLVLSAETHEGELMEVAKGIRKAGGENTLVVIQPMTKAEKTDAVPTGEQLLRWQDKVAGVLPNVRVIPQTHKMMEML